MKYRRSISSVIPAVLLGWVTISFSNQALAQGGTWATNAPMPTARYGLAAGVVNNIFYAVGGFNNEAGSPIGTTVEAYDPVANAWTAKAPMHTRRVLAAAGAVNGTLYVMGGTDFIGHMFATVEAYDPVTDTWTSKAPMPAPRYGQAVAVVNGILYAIGGWDGFRGRVPDVWAYDPATDTWTAKAPMPTGRMSLAAGVVDGTVYAIGGEINGNKAIGTVEAYDPATDTWTTKAPMPTARLGLAAGVVNGIIYAVGGATEAGVNTHTFLSTVEAYDPATDSWATPPPMPTSRSFLGTGVIADTLYAAGGTIRNTGLATMEAFTPTPVPIEVAIVIKPESINPRNQGKILVAILTTDAFDATAADPSTVRFGAAGTEAAPVRAALVDFGGGGGLDLVLHFDTQDTGIVYGDTSASVTGKTYSGQTFEGSATIRTVRGERGSRPADRAHGGR
jgi:N-acetylneuraminic acid mutarotase